MSGEFGMIVSLACIKFQENQEEILQDVAAVSCAEERGGAERTEKTGNEEESLEPFARF